MKGVLYFICFILATILAQDNATIDYYVSAIEQFNNEVVSYVLPTSSKSYEGTEKNQVCSDAGKYDFIIIGAGASGAVLANRLTEIKKWSVLLIEAGGPENNITDIPAEDRNLWLSKYNWGYFSQPQENGMGGYVNNSISIPRGKAVGGSTVINSLIYARGNEKDFDTWASNGSPGWSYADVLPYFIKSENTSEPHLDPGYHGTKGPWHMEYSRIFDKIGEAFLEASNEKGRPTIDYNGRSDMGSSILQVNEINGRRDSTGKSYIAPAIHRTNLRVVTNSLVLKIMINNSTKIATGVKYIREGVEYCVQAKKEVVLSAGTLNTPQILMLSGIGPSEELQKHNISQIQDLPVGKNMWDHLLLSFQYFTSNYTYPELPKNSQQNTEQIRENVIAYLNGQGPYTSSGMEQAVGYASPFSNNKDVPDVEYVLHAGRNPVQSYEEYLHRDHYTVETYESIAKKIEVISAFHIHSVLLHPKSRGEVTLKSSSPYDYPLIDPKYFSNPVDAQVFLAAVKDIISLSQTEAYQRYNASMVNLTHPLCQPHPYGSDDFYLCMIKTLATTTHHFAGTCAMGPRWKSTSVVDRFLRVHGVGRLRVVDCSVVPVSLSGHTAAVGVMIGEKAADIMKLQWKTI